MTILSGVDLRQFSGSGMSVIYILLTISIVVAVIFFIAFILSVKRGQYDDPYTPSVRMLFEDELVKKEEKSEKAEKAEANKSIQLNKSQNA